MAFLFAGSETTATSTCWTLYHLTQNPDVYKKLVAEVDSAMKGADIHLSTLETLTISDRNS